MQIFNRNIKIEYFIPPIISMMMHKANKHHPFDNLPKSINAKYILDVGANKGEVSLAGLRSYPSASVICFKRVRSTFEMLKETLKD